MTLPYEANFQRLHERFKSLAKHVKENKLDFYKPIPPQKAFLDEASLCKALIAGNQTGKTTTCGYEFTLHVTGRYPKDWKGYRFNKPIIAWLTGVSHQKNLTSLQPLLFGDVNAPGTGYIPKECLDINEKGELNSTNLTHLKDGISFCKVRHFTNGVFDGWSELYIYAGTQDRKDFQSNTIDLSWIDEEIPDHIHAEIKMRCIVKNGLRIYSFTPLEEQFNLAFELTTSQHCKVHRISMRDCPWFDEAKIEMLTEGLSEDEKERRINGVVTFGSGLIFKFPQEDYVCPPFEIPVMWKRIGGLDQGLNHPTAACVGAIEPNTKTIFVYGEFFQNFVDIAHIAGRLNVWGKIPYAMSHDAFSYKLDSPDRSIADQFLEFGVEGFSAGRDPFGRIEVVKTLFSRGQIQIFSTCTNLLKQLLIYKTKRTSEGGLKIVKTEDDMVDAFTHMVCHVDKAVSLIQNGRSGLIYSRPGTPSSWTGIR